MILTCTSSLELPTQATASAFSPDGIHLAVGSDDGSVRLYRPPEPKVRKAIRGLGASVSSILFHASASEEDGRDFVDIWVASGKSVYRFNLGDTTVSDKMILTRSDASLAKEIGQDDEDVVNQLALSANRAYLACTSDAGGVYVLDVSSPSLAISKMKSSHESIAWTSSFIPDRPNELLTGGYDCVLLLHDFKLRTLLGRLDISPAPSLAPGISSLPPFITALALSSRGAVAIGTADGRVWVGLGGVKQIPSDSGSGGKKSKSKTKRSRKWGGLNAEEGFFVKVGEGLIAGLQFITPDALLSCTVHGKLELHHLTENPSSSNSSPRQVEVPPGGLSSVWSGQSTCAKVDVLAYNGISSLSPGADDRDVGVKGIIAVTGVDVDKKRGAVELWELREPDLSARDGENISVDTNIGASEQTIIEEEQNKGEWKGIDM